MLLKASDAVAKTGLVERRLRSLQGRQGAQADGELADELAKVIEDFNEQKRQLTVELERMIEEAHVWKDYDNDAIPN